LKNSIPPEKGLGGGVWLYPIKTVPKKDHHTTRREKKGGHGVHCVSDAPLSPGDGEFHGWGGSDIGNSKGYTTTSAGQGGGEFRRMRERAMGFKGRKKRGGSHTLHLDEGWAETFKSCGARQAREKSRVLK